MCSSSPNTWAQKAAEVTRDSLRNLNLETCDYDLLVALTEHSDWMVRAATARASRLSTESFERLSRDASARVRAEVAANFRAPERILERLCGDDDPEVREALTTNLNIGPTIIMSLFADEDRSPDSVFLRWMERTTYEVPLDLVRHFWHCPSLAIRERMRCLLPTLRGR